MKKSALSIFLVLGAVSASAAPPSVPYPTGYRDWHHVKSMVIEQGNPLYDSFGGIHSLYANAKAMHGYQTGHFPDGSVIAFDLLEAVDADRAITEGKRKVLGVMVKSAAKYKTTGGWGFEAFAGGDPAKPVVGDKAAQNCFACHTSQKAHGYVFSTPHD